MEGDFDYDHLRQISQIQVQHFAKLTERTRKALAEALEVGLFQRPLDNRQPQQGTQIPHENFKLHRILCPYYELALANRFPRKIKAETLNHVFQLTETDFANRVSGRSKTAKRLRGESGQQSFELSSEEATAEYNPIVEEYDSDAE